MARGIKDIFEGVVYTLGLGAIFRGVLDVFLASLSLVLGRGPVQLSGAESWILSKIAIPGVVGPFEALVLAGIVGLILMPITVVLGPGKILKGVAEVFTASKSAIFGSAAEPNAGHPGLAFALGIAATLVVIAILTGAVKAVLALVGGLVGSVSAAAVGGASTLFIVKLICIGLLIFGVVGFFASLTLLAALVLKRVS